jgi:predicted DNA-binding transcriptional regulator YafY
MQDRALIEVVLQFSSELAPYIRTKPIHPTQSKIRYLESGEMILSIKVIPNYELERLILSFGDKVKIISPEDLQQKIIKRISGSLSLYK